jgi:Rps23 Pro-64 3,4-dihydroxylase Tpa1-like proline 4-hydroxylase
LILRSSDPAQVHQKVTPAFGRSVVFVRSDHSWHGVERVRRGISAIRKSVLLHFSR